MDTANYVSTIKRSCGIASLLPTSLHEAEPIKSNEIAITHLREDELPLKQVKITQSVNVF